MASKDINCKRENINNFQCKNLALNIMGLDNLGLRNNLKQENEQPFIWDKNKVNECGFGWKRKKIDIRKGHINLADNTFEFASAIKCNISPSISASFGILIPKLITRRGLCCDVSKLETAWKTLNT